MRMLFSLDLKDYDPDAPVFVRPSARGIIRKGNKLAMIHSLQYDYYKFPGGGIEAGEDAITALCREVAEEAGLQVIPDSIRPYGQVHRIQQGQHGDTFVQDNYYYLCDAETFPLPQHLDDYEAQERFTLEWITPAEAIAVNQRDRTGDTRFDPVYRVMLQREAKVLGMLVAEGLLPAGG